MPGSEKGLRAAAKKLEEPMKNMGLSAQYDTLMVLIDRAEELDPGTIVCLSNFFLRSDVSVIKEETSIKEDLKFLMSIIANMLAEYVNPPDQQIIKEQ